VAAVAGMDAGINTTQVVTPYLFYENVGDAHFEHARSCGADIIDEPADQPFGDRIYLVRDPEGHEWYIAQHLRDVSLDELPCRLGG
jgi:uncharacterized glyoxalase superfamily protein PhnB